MSKLSTDISKKTAFKFVILLSVVSLFADMTYEGARSITGPFLATLGASAAVVGFVAGLGEFLGYSLRIFSGFIADRTQKYWMITIIGYFFNLLAVPMLALAGNWWLAAFLIVLERTGKAIRVPPKDAMLSHAGNKLGMGWVFGLHEAIDQLGALSGPLIVATVLYFKGSYKESFAALVIPAVMALIILFYARWLYPHPQSLEVKHDDFKTAGINHSFWIYLLGASLIAAGYTDFSLMAFHFQKTALLSPIWIPIAYAISMGLNSFSAPLLGFLYDKKGFVILVLVSLITCFFAPLVFLGNKVAAFLGIGLWSIGVSAHESLMRAIVGNMVIVNKRSSAYGIFNTGYGIFWFLGSFLMGVLYDISIFYLVVFSVGIQLLAIPILWHVRQKIKT